MTQTTISRKHALLSQVLDFLLFGYSALVLHRIVFYKVVFPSEIPASISSGLAFLYLLLAAMFTAVFNTMNASPAKKIMGFAPADSWRENVALHFLWIIATSTIIAGWIITKVSVIELFSGEGLRAASRIFGALLSPNFAIFEQALYAMIETIYLALLATLFALPVSFILGFASARNLMKDHPVAFAIYNILRVSTNFARSIEPLIWAIVFSVWVGIGPFAGALALMIHTIASLAKQYSEQIEDIDRGPMEAIESTGAKPLQVIWFAVVPQIITPFLSFTIYRWDINVRMATIIGMVGGGGIGTLLMQYQGLAKWNEVGLIVLMIAIVVWAMDYISAKIREAIQ